MFRKFSFAVENLLRSAYVALSGGHGRDDIRLQDFDEKLLTSHPNGYLYVRIGDWWNLTRQQESGGEYT